MVSILSAAVTLNLLPSVIVPFSTNTLNIETWNEIGEVPFYYFALQYIVNRDKKLSNYSYKWYTHKQRLI